MIEILFGPIASGKSTYALTRAREGAIIVNDDAITLAVHGGDYLLYDQPLKPLYKGIQLAMISFGLIAGRDVVIDSTALTRGRRDRLRLLALSFDVECRLVIFRGGCFIGEEDGNRRFEANARNLSLAAWRSVGRSHAKIAQGVGSSEHDQYSEVRVIPWKENPK